MIFSQEHVHELVSHTVVGIYRIRVFSGGIWIGHLENTGGRDELVHQGSLIEVERACHFNLENKLSKGKEQLDAV